ncbi:MAG: hypothetical protein ABI147_04805 [Acidobacteriaceae bacterium]
MARLVWSERGDDILIPCKAICGETFQRLRHGDDVMEDQQIGDEVVVFDELAPLVPDALGG